MPGGDAFVKELTDCWEAGDAAFPLDLRLPAPARQRLLDAFAPQVLVGPDGDRVQLRGGRPVEDGDALVVATSGTTGEPKGAVLTHRAVAASAIATSSRLGVDPSGDRWYACLPLAHIGGLAVVTRSLLTGTPVDVAASFDVEAATAAARNGATLVSLVATALRRLGEAGASAWRKIVLGGAAPPELIPPNTVVTWGMTETGSGVVYDGTPLEGVELRTSGASELEVRGPMLLRSYRDGGNPFLAGGWFPTGDAAELAEDGTLHLRGRLKDVIISGGENVWPAEVEKSLTRHPSVAEALVSGTPDPEWGETVVASIVPAGDIAPTLDELREHVKAHLGPWAAPRELRIVASLPRTPSGKLLRRRDP